MSVLQSKTTLKLIDALFIKKIEKLKKLQKMKMRIKMKY